MSLPLRILHGFVDPLLKRAIDLVHAAIRPQLEKLEEQGFESDYTAKLDRALKRFCWRFSYEHVAAKAKEVGRPPDEIAQEMSVIPELRETFEKLADIAVALSEMEKYHLPRWIKWLAEDLKAEGCI